MSVLLGGERLKFYLLNIAEKLRKVEEDGFKDPPQIASAITTSQYAQGFWDRKFANIKFPPELTASLKDNGIIQEVRVRPETSRGKEDCYLIHFMCPVAAYNNNSRLLRAAINLFGIDPGIQTERLKEELPNPLHASFWYSIGGDYLTDFVSGVVDQDEYRADLLGLTAARKLMHSGSPLCISDMVAEAGDDCARVLGENYSDLPDFKLAQNYINPVFGHLLVRQLAKLDIFQRNALIPVDKGFLI